MEKEPKKSKKSRSEAAGSVRGLFKRIQNRRHNANIVEGLDTDNDNSLDTSDPLAQNELKAADQLRAIIVEQETLAEEIESAEADVQIKQVERQQKEREIARLNADVAHIQATSEATQKEFAADHKRETGRRLSTAALQGFAEMNNLQTARTLRRQMSVKGAGVAAAGSAQPTSSGHQPPGMVKLDAQQHLALASIFPFLTEKPEEKAYNTLAGDDDDEDDE